MNEAPPATKSDLLEHIRTARAELHTTLDGLSDERLSAPGPDGGWSVKDHLAHLAAWQEKVLALMTGRPPYEALGVDRATYDSGSENVINAAIHERWWRRPAADSLAFFRQAYEELVSAVEGLSDGDLARPYAPDDPTDTRQLVDGIAANSYKHDAEHAGWIHSQLDSFGK